MQILSPSHLPFLQVHGKNLFLAFVAAGCPLRPSTEEPVPQGEAASGTSSPAQVSAPQTQPEEEEPQELQCSRPDAPGAVGGPGSWLRFHFGLFGSVRTNEFSRANRANKRGDWKDPMPRYLVFFCRSGEAVFCFRLNLCVCGGVLLLLSFCFLPLKILKVCL